MREVDVTNEAALNIRKFPRELLGKLKNAAAVRGMKLQEYVTEVLAKSQEGASAVVTGVNVVKAGKISKNISYHAADVSAEISAVVGAPMELTRRSDERQKRIRERWNMDSRDCLECGVAPNLKHKAYCSIGDRLAGETG